MVAILLFVGLYLALLVVCASCFMIGWLLPDSGLPQAVALVLLVVGGWGAWRLVHDNRNP